MTLKIVDAALDVYDPANASDAPADADVTLTEPDFEFITVDSRIQDLVDVGQAHVRNRDGLYTGRVRSGSRVRFRVQTEEDASLNHVWTGMVRNVDYVELGAKDARLELALDDFVFAVLDTRKVVDSFSQEQISGTDTSILNFILRQNASELGRSQIDTFTETATPIWNGTPLMEATQELADRVDALVYSDDRDLVFTSLDAVSPLFTLQSRDRTIARATENDDGLANEVRVNGGRGSVLENSQESVDAYTRVNDTTRLQVQVSTRKSALGKVEVWTRPVAGSSSNLLVRVQSNASGSNNPVDPDDQTSDVVSKNLSQEFLAADGFTTILLPDHNLPGEDPWILIESTAGGGIDIGVDTSGVPAYRQYYPYPTAVIEQDNTSIQQYRRREAIHNRTAVTDRSQLIDIARAITSHTNEPDREMRFAAESARAHALDTGDIVSVVEPDRLNFEADAIVRTVQHRYDGVNLDTTLTLQDVNTV